MSFREDYGEFELQETVDAIFILLKNNGVYIDDKSFTWTIVGALFDNGIISKSDFEEMYSSLLNNKKLAN